MRRGSQIFSRPGEVDPTTKVPRHAGLWATVSHTRGFNHLGAENDLKVCSSVSFLFPVAPL